MKITATKKEDILRRKAEYEEDYNRRKAQHDEELHKFKEAQYAVADPVKEELEKLFAKYPSLHPIIEVDPWGRFGSGGMSARIRVNDNEKFHDDIALAWDYSAYIDKDGQVKRETSSWSGMQAVTAEQLVNLEQTLGALKELSTLDWKGLLDRALPEYKDYVTTRDPSFERDKPDFNKELKEAELEELVGQRKMVEVKPFQTSWYYDSRFRNPDTIFVAIVKDSGSQYTIKECPKSAFKRGEAKRYFDADSMHRVKKDSIVPVEPLNIIEV